MNRLRLAVFDVDGTLIDSEHNIISAMTEAWARLQLGVPDPAAVRRIIGLSLVEACAALLPWATHETHRAVAEQYKDAFRASHLLPESVAPLFPGVVQVFDALEAEGWLLGLATGKSRRGVDRMLGHYRLEGRFVTIQTADDNPGNVQAVSTPRDIAATFVHAYQEMVQTGVLENLDLATKRLRVERNRDNPNRVDIYAPLDTVNPLDVIATNAVIYSQFRAAA